MITCVTYENLHRYGHAFRSQFRLRHQCFIERQQYNVSQHKGMEFDQYDTPAAIYLVAMSPYGKAWGCSRLTPVERGSMIRDLWPNLIKDSEQVFQTGVWEGTRFCIDKSLDHDLRNRICRELVLAYFEIGLKLGIDKVIGVMPPYILYRVFKSAGCDYKLLGKTEKISSGDRIAAASMDITSEALENVRITTGIFEQVVLSEDISEVQAA